MSETDKPESGPEQGPQQSGAEEPVQPEQQSQAGQAPPAQPAPPPPAPRRPPRTIKTWIAAVAAAVLLVGGGLGGYFIGAANDNGPDRPGFSRGWDHHRPDARDFPWRGKEPPFRR